MAYNLIVFALFIVGSLDHAMCLPDEYVRWLRGHGDRRERSSLDNSGVKPLNPFSAFNSSYVPTDVTPKWPARSQPDLNGRRLSRSRQGKTYAPFRANQDPSTVFRRSNPRRAAQYPNPSGVFSGGNARDVQHLNPSGVFSGGNARSVQHPNPNPPGVFSGGNAPNVQHPNPPGVFSGGNARNVQFPAEIRESQPVRDPGRELLRRLGVKRPFKPPKYPGIPLIGGLSGASKVLDLFNKAKQPFNGLQLPKYSGYPPVARQYPSANTFGNYFNTPNYPTIPPYDSNTLEVSNAIITEFLKNLNKAPSPESGAGSIFGDPKKLFSEEAVGSFMKNIVNAIISNQLRSK